MIPDHLSDKLSIMLSTRRTILGALAGAPAILRGQSKSGSKNPILGSGKYTYECIHDWGEVPKNIVYGNTHSVVEDSNGFIWVQHTVHKSSPSDDTLLVFDPKGRFVQSSRVGPTASTFEKKVAKTFSTSATQQKPLSSR